jgi:hypothetical protein
MVAGLDFGGHTLTHHASQVRVGGGAWDLDLRACLAFGIVSDPCEQVLEPLLAISTGSIYPLNPSLHLYASVPENERACGPRTPASDFLVGKHALNGG